MDKSKSIYLIAVLSFVALIMFQLSSAQALTTKINFVGDIGCKSNSISNLENLGESDIPFVGLGDYMYNCNPGDDVNAKGATDLGGLYDEIEKKVGYPGNHEKDRHQQEAWAEDEFRYGDQGYGAWRLRDIGIIGIDPFEDFDEGSDQFAFVERKTQEFISRPLLNWIVYVVHEPLWTPTTIGGHGPNTDLRDTFEPIIREAQESDKGVLLVQAHNHVTGVGVVSDMNMLVCGGGGYGGDELGKLSGYEWGTDEMAICEAEFNDNAVNLKVVNVDGEVLRNQIFTK